ncbi:hypothetical protein SDC9_73778 [bioreactor metagenome]|uniref:Uncharacterized protein n=1 Tax=bioreactor metagenome TaxID=1076179 RepID=A0A644YGZ7_9ZZZZ
MEALAAPLDLLQHGEHRRVLDRGLQLNEEDKLKVPACHGAAFQLRHVYAKGRGLGENVVQRAGFVLTGDDQADAVGSGVNGGFLGNADEAGVVVVAVLHVPVQNAQAVQLRAGVGGQGRHMRVLPLRHQLGGGGGVVAGNHPHAGKALQKMAALADGLRVGIDFRQLVGLCAGKAQQLVADAQPGAAHNGQATALKQIVHSPDGAVGAVFNGQHAEPAQAGLHGGNHRFKALHVDDGAPGQQMVTGGLRVGALHALTGHKASLGKDLGSRRERRPHLRRHLRGRAEQLRLPGAGEVEQRGEKLMGVALLVSRFRCHPGEDFPLPCTVGDGQALLVFGGGHMFGKLHAPQKELQQLLIHRVDLFADFRKFHIEVLLLILLQKNVQQHRRHGGLHHRDGPVGHAGVVPPADHQLRLLHGAEAHGLLRL